MEASDSSIQGFIFLLASPKRRPSAIFIGNTSTIPSRFPLSRGYKTRGGANARKESRDQNQIRRYMWFIALIFFMPRTNKALITWPSVVLFYKKRVERY